MQKNEPTKLALKMAGIYILVKAILYIPSAMTGFRMINLSSDGKVGAVALFITFALLVILGLWLTLKNKPQFEKATMSHPDLIPLGLAIGGVIIFALAISELPFLVSKLLYTSTSDSPIAIIGGNNNLENTMKLAGNLLQLLLGNLLFFKAKYFAKLIK